MDALPIIQVKPNLFFDAPPAAGRYVLTGLSGEPIAILDAVNVGTEDKPAFVYDNLCMFISTPHARGE